MPKPKITVQYYERDDGWWKVMRDGKCVEDFRNKTIAEQYARTLREQGI
jgi:hypothetical protein